MTADEADRLLADIRAASDEVRRLKAAMHAAATARGKVVETALDAGIPRANIADAAGVNRDGVYKIASRAAR